jgi:hypothetical protein
MMGRPLLEPGQAAAGTDPDNTAGLCRESIQVAIVPDQSIVVVIVIPCGAIPNVNSLVGSRPKSLPCVEAEKVDSICFV